jgi:hypothetical protein
MLQASSTRDTRQAARELKFLVAPEQAADILDWARGRLAPDPHGSGESGDEYRTTTVYYDTDDLAVYWRQGSYGRSKYRIRRYGSSDVVFLERKLRTSDMLTKRRTAVPMSELTYLQGSAEGRDWPGHWFSRRLEARELKPVVRVSYRRHARVGIGSPDPVRLTLDDQIAAIAAAGTSFAPAVGVPVLAARTVLEIKYRRELPALMRHLVELFALEPAPVSKYRLAVDALSLPAASQASA